MYCWPLMHPWHLNNILVLFLCFPNGYFCIVKVYCYQHDHQTKHDNGICVCAVWQWPWRGPSIFRLSRGFHQLHWARSAGTGAGLSGCRQLPVSAQEPGATWVNNNKQTTTVPGAVLTYVGVAERLLRMDRGTAARFRELLRPPKQQQRERAKDAVNVKRHFHKRWCDVSSASPVLRRCVAV